jgi:hypothetical protein
MWLLSSAYRLKPTSPCRKKASDGGDIGCRFTPEMLEKALELRRKRIIKFCPLPSRGFQCPREGVFPADGPSSHTLPRDSQPAGR